MPGSQRPRPRDLALGLPACAAAGLVVGTIGTFKHQVGVSAATGGGWPIGLVAALVMVALVLAALRASLPSRLYAAAASVGVLAAIGLLTLPGPGGSHVILDTYAGIAWLVAPFVVCGAAVLWPRRRARQEPDGILAADGRTGTSQ